MTKDQKIIRAKVGLLELARDSWMMRLRPTCDHNGQSPEARQFGRRMVNERSAQGARRGR